MTASSSTNSTNSSNFHVGDVVNVHANHDSGLAPFLKLCGVVTKLGEKGKVRIDFSSTEKFSDTSLTPIVKSLGLSREKPKAWVSTGLVTVSAASAIANNKKRPRDESDEVNSYSIDVQEGSSALKTPTSGGYNMKGATPSASMTKGKGKGKKGINSINNNSNTNRNDAKRRKKGQPINPANEICGHCGQKGHIAKQCTFGLDDTDRYLFCPRAGHAGTALTNTTQDFKNYSSPVGCFVRKFLVILKRAKDDFDVNDLRGSGRWDVGVSSVGSSLFRSQSMRQNASCHLWLQGSNR